MPDNVTAIATRQRPSGGALAMWDSEQLDVIKTLICPGASDAELALFAQVCQKTGLSPFSRQIYGFMRWDGRKKREVLSIQTSIDGFRLSAQRSGEYGGQAGPQWCDRDMVWRDVWLESHPPAAARVGVYRKGWSQPTWAVATWQEYVQTNKEGQPLDMWRRMPANQLAKCAESLALRKVFPQELSGLYSKDEMQQAADGDESAASFTVVNTDSVPCDAAHYNRAWHAAVKGTRFEDEDTRHKVVAAFTKNAYNSLSAFLENATTDEAERLIAAIKSRIAKEAATVVVEPGQSVDAALKNVSPERADLNLQLRAAVKEATDLGLKYDVPVNFDEWTDETVRETLGVIVNDIEAVRGLEDLPA